MRTVNIHAAKTHLSKLLDEVSAGEEIIIAKAGKPLARLVPLDTQRPQKRRLGGLKGKINIPAEFYDPWPEEFIDLFYGKE